MKDFLINLGMWIVLFVPIYGLMFALAFIADGNGLGFAISIIVTIVASLVLYRMLHKNNLTKTTKL